VSIRPSLGRALQKLLFAGACFALAALYFEISFRNYAAENLASSGAMQLVHAVELAPRNAGYHHRLGRHLFFTQQNVNGAIEQYRQAADLNPRAAAVWLDLATAHAGLKQTSQQQQALEHALAADPRSPNTAWIAGQQYFAVGQTELALRQLRVVIAHDLSTASAAIDLAWRATHDPELLLREAIPQSAAGHLAFLNYMVEHEEPAAAAQAWAEMVKLNDKFPPRLALPYVEFLLSSKHHDSTAAVAVWRVLQELESDFPALADPGLIVNAGFEQPIINAGLDWRFTPISGVNAAIDINDARSGTRSLAVVLDGRPVDDVGVIQYLALRPSTRYEFSAYIRDESIAGMGGLRFQIGDAESATSYYTSAQFPETDSWQLLRGSFRTPVKIGGTILKIVRSPAGQPFRGRFWVDDVELTAK
jgi:tetratricopeptide (TPR) repeat protein